VAQLPRPAQQAPVPEVQPPKDARGGIDRAIEFRITLLWTAENVNFNGRKLVKPEEAAAVAAGGACFAAKRRP